MAAMFPDSLHSRVVFSSSAEEQFYKECQKQLSSGWHIYHSCTLSTSDSHEGVKDNEIDFVCYHRLYGLVVLEVKGGRIRFDVDQQQFYSMNRHGESFPIKNPFQQALVWKSRFLRFLKQRHIKLPVSHGIILPSVNSDDLPESAAFNKNIVIDRQGLSDLEGSLKKLALTSHPSQYFDFEDVQKEIDKILRGSHFETHLRLRDYLDVHDVRLKDVENIQDSFIAPLLAMRKVGVEGQAGTGKTYLASLLANQLSHSGKRVLFLSSNALLNARLRSLLKSDVDLYTYQEFASSYGVNLYIAPQDFEGEKSDWHQYVAPEKLKNSIDSGNRHYDVLICDEAQDVQPFWWEALEAATPDQANSQMYVFFDRSQGVFSGSSLDASGDYKPEDVLPVSAPYFPLVTNYRTTREITTFAQTFRKKSSALGCHAHRLGHVPQLITYKDKADALTKLTQLVKTLVRDEEVNPSELTLLSARNPSAEGSILQGVQKVGRFDLKRLSSDSDQQAAAIPVSTIASFKGMETSIGIVLNLSEYNLPIDHPIMASLVYVACTRAKHMLYVFVKEGDGKAEAFKQALNNIEKSGSLVIEPFTSEFEFLGTVTHYNPDRVGWLSVDDDAFSQGSIMFFPHDVAKASLRSIQVGSRIKFRPKFEGYTTIASELSLAIAREAN